MINEYLTAEENETINKDLDLTSDQIMDREEKELISEVAEIEAMEKELSELATLEVLPMDDLDEFTMTDLENYANTQAYKNDAQELANQQIEELAEIEA